MTPLSSSSGYFRAGTLSGGVERGGDGGGSDGKPGCRSSPSATITITISVGVWMCGWVWMPLPRFDWSSSLLVPPPLLDATSLGLCVVSLVQASRVSE